jgi:hypothetical protein
MARLDSAIHSARVGAPMDFSLLSTDTRAMNNYHVYILASRRDGTLYIGVTNDDLVRRIWEHREGLIAGLARNVSQAWEAPGEAGSDRKSQSGMG